MKNMKTMKTIITVCNHDRTGYHHMPETAERPDLTGLTLRQALRKLREIDFGDLGGCSMIDLSDGTYLEVCNMPASDGGWLIGVHVIRRKQRGEILATYKMQA